MRNQFLEIYWVDDSIGFGLRCRGKKKFKATEINKATWMALEEFDVNESIFMVHVEFPSLWQSKKDKENKVVKAAYGLTYYMNSDSIFEEIDEDGKDINEFLSRLYFCDRPVNQRNNKGSIKIILFLFIIK
jgi:hypothetical protein